MSIREQKADKFHEITIRPTVTLPAVSTLDPEREYPGLQFLSDWVLASPGIKTDDNLEHYFEWDEAIEELVNEIAAELGKPEPKIPAKLTRPEMPEDRSEESLKKYAAEVQRVHADNDRLMKEHNEAITEWRKAIADASVGRKLYISEDAFKAGHEAAKKELDDASKAQGPMGPRLHVSFQPKIFRHYHGMRQSKAVRAKDIPVKPEPSAD